MMKIALRNILIKQPAWIIDQHTVAPPGNALRSTYNSTATASSRWLFFIRTLGHYPREICIRTLGRYPWQISTHPLAVTRETSTHLLGRCPREISIRRLYRATHHPPAQCCRRLWHPPRRSLA